MAEAVAHRGPDGQGVAAFDGCGLAHRRLSIIDLSDGAKQPMASADGRVHLAFNGEVYNFIELRKELSARGHSFRTSSDTEVILAGYLEWGEGVVGRLDGMFGVAIWDDRQKRLLLARDRTGKKPLYVYEDERKVIFASEVKSILVHPGVDDQLRIESIPQFLAHGYVPTPATFWVRIRKLRPSAFEIFQLGTPGSRQVQYWEFPLGPARDIRDPREVQAEVRRLFFAAVKRRLVADVPLGAFLSGGLDSTLVVAAMSELAGQAKTFSIGFEGYPEWDETRYARLVAQRYGTDHTEFKVRADSFELIDKLAWHYDEPLADSSTVPTAIMARLTRQKVTVALTGDGGDELFAGYVRFGATAGAELVPPALRGMARRLLEAVPPGERERSLWDRVRRFALRASQPLPERLRSWMAFFTARELELLLKPELAHYAVPATLGASYAVLDGQTTHLDTMNRVLFLNARTYLVDDLNVKMDRACMAASLEARAPFLDTALMEYVFSLPGSLKLRGTTSKWVLKQAMMDLVPEEILHRKKMGFGVPLGPWFRDELRDALRERLLGEGTHLHQYLRRERLEEMIDIHNKGHRDLGAQFLSLWLLELWLRAQRATPERPASRVGV